MCVGAMAGEALFVLRDPPAGPRALLASNSLEWDGAHQGNYRNTRVTAVKPEVLAALPPLPVIPRGPFPEWKDSLPDKPVPAAKYPSVAGLISSASGATLKLFVVLPAVQSLQPEEVLAALEARLCG